MKIQINDLRKEILTDTTRFKTIVAGRRWGKTILSLVWLLNGEIQPHEKRWFIAPTYKQGRMIAWGVMKQMFREMGVKFNESSLTVFLPNQAEISIKGSDKEDSLRGAGVNRVVLDEYATMKPNVWGEVIFPMLATSEGEALFIGTPRGYNHFYNLYLKGGQEDNWKSFQFRTIDGGFVSEEEIERARDELDERTFRQEFEATFETYTGQIYYNFDVKKHTRKLDRIMNDPLYLTCDFNKSPMVWLTCQESGDTLKVVGEECIKVDAKTDQLANRWCDRYRDHTNKLDYLTGDATNNYTTHRDYTTDYIIIKKILRANGWNVVIRVPSHNAILNNRVNVICSMFQHDKIFIDKSCSFLINDLQLNELDTKGAKDKKSDPNQTHASDAFDYIVWGLYSKQFYSKGVRQL